MQYDHSDSFLSAAFAVVKQYDPKTYARMARDSSWYVFGEYPEGDDGYGQTASAEANPSLGGRSFTEVNYDAIVNNEVQADPTLFAAAVLVHEYKHAHQSKRTVMNTGKSEGQAFHAGSEFARQLPGEDGKRIKLLSDATLESLHSNPGYAQQDMLNKQVLRQS